MKPLIEYYEVKPDLNNLKNLSQNNKDLLEEIFAKDVTHQTANRYKKALSPYLSIIVDEFRHLIPINISSIEDLMRGTNETIEDRLRFVSALEPSLSEKSTVSQIREMLDQYKKQKTEINEIAKDQATIYEIIKDQQAQLFRYQKYVDFFIEKITENESFIEGLLKKESFIEAILDNKKFIAGVKELMEAGK